MDINASRQQINVFNKGMNTDTSDAYLNNELYRYAENLRFFTEKDSNSGELRLIEGWKKLDYELNNIDHIIAATTIRDYGIIIGRMKDLKITISSDNYNHNDVISRDPQTGNIIINRPFDNNGHKILGKITIVYRYKITSDEILWHTSGAVLNDEIDSKTIEDSSTWLSVQLQPGANITYDMMGDAWCVLRIKKGEPGAVVVYKSASVIPDNISLVTRYESENNIKLYIGGTNEEIISINIMDEWADDSKLYSYESSVFLFGGFGELKKISGDLFPAIILYQYILYNKWLNSSQLSPLSKPVSLYRDGNPDIGYEPDKSSGIGINGVIKERIGKYNKIRIYRIQYTQVGQSPKVSLIIDDDLTEDDYSFNDINQNSILGEYSVEELYGQDTIPVSAKHIESKNDYLFASNIKYIIDKSSMDEYNRWDANAQPTESDAYFNMSIDFDNIPTSYGSNISNVSWEFVTTEQPIDDTHGNIYMKSLRRDELYRYGIVLYDKYGYKLPVKWIADIRTPSYNTLFGKFFDTADYKSNILGIRFTIRNLNKDIFPAYEIVRCNRTYDDRATISLGIIGLAMVPITYDGTGVNRSTSTIDASPYFAPPFLTLSNIHTTPWYRMNDSYSYPVGQESCGYTDKKPLFLFCSPEFSYIDGFDQNIKTSSYLQPCYHHRLQYQSFYPETYIQYEDGNHFQLYNNLGENSGSDFLVNRFGPNGIGFKIDASQLTISPENFYATHPNAVYGNDAEDIVEKIDGVDYVKPVQNVLQLNRSFTPNFNYSKLDGSQSEINKFKFYNGTDPKSNTFDNGTVYTYNNTLIYVQDGIEYIPWSAASIWSHDLKDFFKSKNSIKDFNNIFYQLNFNTNNSLVSSWYDSINNDWKKNISDSTDFGVTVERQRALFRFPIGSSGKCLLFTTDTGIVIPTSSGNIEDPTYVVIFNLRNNVTPYGVKNMYNRNNSTYSSHGCFFENDENSHDVYDGDCFIQNFYYTLLHTFNRTQKTAFVPLMQTVYVIPIETDIDIDSDVGSTYKRNNNVNQLDYASNVNGLIQTTNAYVYNTAYNTEEFIAVSTGLSEQYTSDNTDYDYRTIYSNPKENGESIDNWLKFKAANFIDVDTRYGQITGLKLFKDSLIFWQENATGVFSVNERTILLDVNETNIILGNGDILLRYDYMSTIYGMKPDLNCHTVSDTTLYWWDGFKRDIISYSGGQSVQPMKKEKQIANHINKSNDIENPQMAYDTEYNEILMNVVDGGPIVYNEGIQLFTAVYKTPFNHSMLFTDSLYLMHNSAIYKWNEYDENELLFPLIKYIINTNNTFVKVYDNVEFGGRFYGGDDGFNLQDYKLEHKTNLYPYDHYKTEDDQKQPLKFEFSTPLKQHSDINPTVTNREYDFRFAVPRNNNSAFGDRLRGKTMQCTLSSNNSSKDFSILYIITKFRISWS